MESPFPINSRERWVVLHETGAPSHYAALRWAVQRTGRELEFVELNFWTQFKAIVRMRSNQQLSKTLRNLRFLFSSGLSGSRNCRVVLGLAPYNPHIFFVRWLLRHAEINMHLSWPYWDGSKQPHWQFLPMVKQAWVDFFNRRVNHIFIATQFAKSNLAHSPFGHAPITVVGHSYSINFFYPPREITAVKPQKLVFVGRLEVSKGIGHLFALAELLPDCQITIIGNGPLKSKVEAAARRLSNIRYLGLCKDRHQLGEELRSSHVLLLPSIRVAGWEEAFGIVLIEAMACGMVPLVTDHIGPVEVLGEEFASLCFTEAGFVAGVCGQLAAWSANTGQFQRDRETAIAMAAEYTTERIAQRWSKALGLGGPTPMTTAAEPVDADVQPLSSSSDGHAESMPVPVHALASEPEILPALPQTQQTQQSLSDIKDAKAAQAATERHAIVWSVLNALGTKGTSLLVYLVLAHALGPETFGVIALSLAITSLLELVSEHRFGPILIQRETLSAAETSSVFYFQAMIGVISALLITLAAGGFAQILKEPQLAFALPWLAIAMLLNTTTFVHEALLKRALKFKVLTVRSMAANLFGGGVGVALAFAGFGLVSMVAMIVVSSIAGAAVLWRTSGWRPSAAFSRPHFIALHRDARYVAATAIAGAATLHANMFIVGFAFGASVAGLYSFALRIYDVLMRVTTFSFSEAAFPILARKTSNLETYRNAFTGLLTSAGTLTVGLLMVVGALAPVLIPVVFGDKWAGAADYLMIYLITGAVISVGAYNDVTLMAFGKTRRIASSYFASLLIWGVQLPLLWVFGPLFPAICWSTKELILFPVKAKWAVDLMEMPWRTYARVMLPVIGAGLLACAAVLLMQHEATSRRSVLVLLGSSLVGFVVFAGAAFVFGAGSMSGLYGRMRALIKRQY